MRRFGMKGNGQGLESNSSTRGMWGLKQKRWEMSHGTAATLNLANRIEMG